MNGYLLRAIAWWLLLRKAGDPYDVAQHHEYLLHLRTWNPPDADGAFEALWPMEMSHELINFYH